MTPPEQEEFLRSIERRVKGEFAIRDEEVATIELSADTEDHISPGGPICIKAMSPERLLVISDAKSVVLAHDEREAATVFDGVSDQPRACDPELPCGRDQTRALIAEAIAIAR